MIHLILAHKKLDSGGMKQSVNRQTNKEISSIQVIVNSVRKKLLSNVLGKSLG